MRIVDCSFECLRDSLTYEHISWREEGEYVFSELVCLEDFLLPSLGFPFLWKPDTTIVWHIVR